MSNMQKSQLILEITRCVEVNRAKTDLTHPCNKIVCYQPNTDCDKFHVPEPWNGDIEKAEILFISSNPSIGLQEVFPTATSEDSYIVDFFDKNFITKPRQEWSRFWKTVNKWTGWILDKDYKQNLLKDYAAVTEIVHCKSRSQYGVSKCRKLCAEKWLNKVLTLFKGKYIVLAGKLAEEYKDFVESFSKDKFLIIQKHPNARKITDETRKIQFAAQIDEQS